MDLFRSRLDKILNNVHPLVVLAQKIDWGAFEEAFTGCYSEEFGAPAKAVRLPTEQETVDSPANLDELVAIVESVEVRAIVRKVAVRVVHAVHSPHGRVGIDGVRGVARWYTVGHHRDPVVHAVDVVSAVLNRCRCLLGSCG